MVQVVVNAVLLACAWIALALGFWNTTNGSSPESIFSYAVLAGFLLVIVGAVTSSADEDPGVVFGFGLVVSLPIGSIVILILDGSQKVDLPTAAFVACWSIVVLFFAGFIAVSLPKTGK